MIALSRLLVLQVLLVLLATPAGLVVVAAAPAAACSCAASPLQEQARAADAVFVATVLEDVDDGGNGTVVFEVDVESVFSGDVETTARLTTAAQGSACGLPVLGGGERWLFLATGGPAAYDVSLCSGSTLAGPRVVREAAAALGAPRAPTASEHADSSGVGTRIDDDLPAQPAYPWWAVGVGAGVVVAVLTSLAWALHPGRRTAALRPGARPRR